MSKALSAGSYMTASRNSLSKHEQPSNEGVFDKNSQGGEQVKFPRHPVPLIIMRRPLGPA